MGDVYEASLDGLRKLASAARETPACVAPRKLAEVRKILSKLVRHADEVARKFNSSTPLEQDDCASALSELLEALEASAGRPQLYARAVCLAMAANRLLSVLCGGVGASPEKQQALLTLVQRARRATACSRCPDRPVVSLSLLGLQLTQLEAGVVCLPVKGENQRVAMAGGRVLVGVVRSCALWKLDEEVLRGTMELLKLGSSAAR